MNRAVKLCISQLDSFIQGGFMGTSCASSYISTSTYEDWLQFTGSLLLSLHFFMVVVQLAHMSGVISCGSCLDTCIQVAPQPQQPVASGQPHQFLVVL